MDLAPSYDHVVIGAGTAGSTLAARLSEDPDRAVPLLEADPHDTDPRIARPASWPALPGSALDGGYRTVPQPGLNGRRLAWPRGRVVDGFGSVNAMAHIRCARSGFDAWTVLTRNGVGEKTVPAVDHYQLQVGVFAQAARGGSPAPVPFAGSRRTARVGGAPVRSAADDGAKVSP